MECLNAKAIFKHGYILCVVNSKIRYFSSVYKLLDSVRALAATFRPRCSTRLPVWQPHADGSDRNRLRIWQFEPFLSLFPASCMLVDTFHPRYGENYCVYLVKSWKFSGENCSKTCRKVNRVVCHGIKWKNGSETCEIGSCWRLLITGVPSLLVSGLDGLPNCQTCVVFSKNMSRYRVLRQWISKIV